MRIKARQGQQILEFLVLFVVVVIILVTFVRPNGPFERSVDKVLNGSFNVMSRQNAVP